MVFHQTQDAERTYSPYVEKAEIRKNVAREPMVEAVKKTFILVRRTKEMYRGPPNKSLQQTPKPTTKTASVGVNSAAAMLMRRGC